MTYEPDSKGKCFTESGTYQSHTYDEADRLIDAGTSYEPFGEISKLPAADSGGNELISTFYVDGQLATQEQHGQTIGYNVDPAGRNSEIVLTGKIAATETLHYAGPGNAPAWTSEPSGNTRRNITAMNGLVATQRNIETPVLQLTNLHGDIVATAEDSETATKLATTITEPTEYGAPASETSPPIKYSWLGANQSPTELSSGVIAMGARSYIPQLGRFLQTDPVAGGSANAYAYTNGNPVNETDLTGEYVENDYVLQMGMEQNVRAIELEAAREAAIRAEAQRKAEEAAWAAAAAAKVAAEEAAEPQWIREYAMGGPSLLEMMAAKGEVPGGGTQEEGAGGGVVNPAWVSSGDGCGDGGYCKGHWVRPSEKGHQHGEPIGGSPFEPFDALCEGFWWAAGAASSTTCGVYGSARYFTSGHH